MRIACGGAQHQRCKSAASFGHLTHVSHLGICRIFLIWAFVAYFSFGHLSHTSDLSHVRLGSGEQCQWPGGWLAAVTLLTGRICPTLTPLPFSPASFYPPMPLHQHWFPIYIMAGICPTLTHLPSSPSSFFTPMPMPRQLF